LAKCFGLDCPYSGQLRTTNKAQ